MQAEVKVQKRDPLDMSQYTLEKLPKLPKTPMMILIQKIGLPLGLFIFFFYHYKLSGTIEVFEVQTKVAPQICYSMLGIFLASLVLWITEAIPNYVTSLLVIIATVLVGIMPEKKAFAFFGHPVMILNIASFILASMLVATGVAKRIALWFIIRAGHRASYIFWTFLVINLLLGAFVNATAAKAALLMPLFMVISAIYGATGGENRNNFGRNLVLQNLLGINVSCGAFLTGSAANLLAVSLLAGAGVKIFYADWFMALSPLAFIQLVIGIYVGSKLIFPLSKEEETPQIEGGLDRVKAELVAMGKMSVDEIKSAVIFLLVLGMWVTEKMHGVPETTVALIGATIALLPGIPGFIKIGVISWNEVDIPWHLFMFSFGAYVLGGGIDSTHIVELGVAYSFDALGIDGSTPKWVIFAGTSFVFAFLTLALESKTARVLIFFPVLIGIAQRFGWDILGFTLPMAFLINQVYVLYFNSKPATICYLSNHYSSYESFKYGIFMLTTCWIMVILWAQYVMPLMGFKSVLW